MAETHKVPVIFLHDWKDGEGRLFKKGEKHNAAKNWSEYAVKNKIVKLDTK